MGSWLPVMIAPSLTPTDAEDDATDLAILEAFDASLDGAILRLAISSGTSVEHVLALLTDSGRLCIAPEEGRLQ